VDERRPCATRLLLAGDEAQHLGHHAVGVFFWREADRLDDGSTHRATSGSSSSPTWVKPIRQRKQDGVGAPAG
jgi:hypothetical protein